MLNVKSYVAIVAIVFTVGAGLSALFPHQAAAGTPPPPPLEQACGSGAMGDSAVCGSRGENIGENFGRNIVNTMLFILGTVAVIMIIFGGFKYVTANGDSSKVSSAKNTILYSVVGLIVAIMAWGIVTFVINRLNA